MDIVAKDPAGNTLPVLMLLRAKSEVFCAKMKSFGFWRNDQGMQHEPTEFATRAQCRFREVWSCEKGLAESLPSDG